MTTTRRMLITSALPYANGHLHLGHLVEHIQTDIWVRAQRMLGHHCISICGDDAHGTPIMLKAQELNMTPEALTSEMRESHEKDFKAFYIDYDYYHTTHSEENREIVEHIYQKLKARGDIVTKTIRQLYDPEKKLFLPDRYVKGQCPKCKTPDQYGDNCEACGATYNPTDLINPVSALSGATPIERESEHYFFDLPKYETLLKRWTRNGHLQQEVSNKLDEWFTAGLKQWDISRDAPYFGFQIPDAPDKYFYVWLDAPIGYMASFKKFCEKTSTSFDMYWGEEVSTELYHFVGKDIVYFHALFWPAVLSGSQHRLPTAIYAHGFLTIDGQKMSKSRGTYVEARKYLTFLNPEYLRYYFAAKLNGGVEDLDLNIEDFIHRVNADLVGKVVNIASRNAGFIHKYSDGYLSSNLCEPELYQRLVDAKEVIIEAYSNRDTAKAIRYIMALSSEVNQYIDAKKPWVLVKEADKLEEVQAICSMGLNLFRVLMTYLKPILPAMAQASERFLNCESMSWNSIDTPLLQHKINPFEPLMQRIERDKVNAIFSK